MQAIGAGGWLCAPDPSDSIFDRLPFFAEAGAELAPGLMSTAIAASDLLVHLGREDLRAAIEDGTTLVSLFANYPASSLAGGPDMPVLTRDADGRLRLQGRLGLVEYGAVADLFFVVATDSAQGRRVLVLVDGRGDGVARAARRTFGSDFRADLDLDLAIEDADLLCSDDDAVWPAVDRAHELLTAIRLMECGGAARAVTRRTVEYVNTRHQFGKPLAQFQAVKQRAADMIILSEGAFLLATEALAAVGEKNAGPVALAWAGMWVPRAFKDVTLSAHQLHGGMGYARESNLFRWSERAKLRELEIEATVDARRALEGADR